MRRACVGFSLLEVLVAFVILALALGVLMRVFSGALNNTVQARRYAQATMIAQSKLAEASAESPMQEGDASGDDDAGFHWRTHISRLILDEGYSELAEKLTLFRIDVEVGWQKGAQSEGQVRMATVRLGVNP